MKSTKADFENPKKMTNRQMIKALKAAGYAVAKKKLTINQINPQPGDLIRLEEMAKVVGENGFVVQHRRYFKRIERRRYCNKNSVLNRYFSRYLEIGRASCRERV